MPAPTVQDAAALIVRLEDVYRRPLTAREGVELLMDNYEALTLERAKELVEGVAA